MTYKIKEKETYPQFPQFLLHNVKKEYQQDVNKVENKKMQLTKREEYPYNNGDLCLEV